MSFNTPSRLRKPFWVEAAPISNLVFGNLNSNPSWARLKQISNPLIRYTIHTYLLLEVHLLGVELYLVGLLLRNPVATSSHSNWSQIVLGLVLVTLGLFEPPSTKSLELQLILLCCALEPNLVLEVLSLNVVALTVLANLVLEIFDEIAFRTSIQTSQPCSQAYSSNCTSSRSWSGRRSSKYRYSRFENSTTSCTS